MVSDEHEDMIEFEASKAQNGWEKKGKPLHTSMKHMMVDLAL